MIPRPVVAALAGFAVVSLAVVVAAGNRPARAQMCPPPIIDFREQQLDAEGKAVTGDNGNPVWIPATATGDDGQTYQLTSADFLPTAYAGMNAAGIQLVGFEFTDEGATLMRQISQRDLGRPLAIFVDGVKLTAPVVQGPIDRQVQISAASQSELDFQDLADRLNAAAAAGGCRAPVAPAP